MNKIKQEAINFKNKDNKEQINNKKIKGFTFIETLIVLGIAGVILAVVISNSGSANNKSKSQQMVADVTAMAMDIKTAYASSSEGFDGLNTQTAIELKLVAPTLSHTQSTIKNQFPSGTVAIETDSSNEFFTITYTKVPTEVCNSVITTLGGSGNMFKSITVGSTVVYDVDGTPLNPSEVGQACSSAEQLDIEFAAS